MVGGHAGLGVEERNSRGQKCAEAWVAFSGTLSGTHVARERRTTQQQSAKILRCVERSVRRGYISPGSRPAPAVEHAARVSNGNRTVTLRYR